MRKITLFVLSLVLALGVFSVATAATITLGTQVVASETTGIGPTNYFWEARRIQWVYTASEIIAAGGSAGTINSIAYDISQIAGGNLVNYKIKMAHTTATDASTHNTATLTTVKNSHTFLPGATGWRTITFDTGFVWNGTDNILFDVSWGVNAGYSSTGQVWLYNNVANQMRGVYSSTASVENTATNTTRLGKLRAQLDITAGGIANPTAFTATAASTTQIDLGWTRNATPDNVLLAWNTSNTFGTPTGSYSAGGSISGGGTVLLANSNATSYNHTGRDPNTTYYYKIWSQNGAGPTYSSGVTANATTQMAPITTFPWTENLTGVTTGTIPTGWTQTGASAHWSAQATNNAGGTSPEFRFYWSPGETSTFRLITPQLDGSVGALQLSFKHLIDYYATPATYAVQYTTNGGSSWTPLWSAVDPPANVGPTTQVVDLSTINTVFQLAWVYDGNSYNTDNWYVDDISVSLAIPAISISETSWDFGLAYNVSSNCTPHYFIAQNTGAGTVTIASAPQFTGTDASQFTLIDANTYPIELDATEYAYWGVKFTPSSYGEKTAYLSIVDDISAKGLSFFAAEEIPAATEGVKAASNATAKSVGALPTSTVKTRATNNVSLRGFGVMGVFEDYFETYSHLSGTLTPWTQYDGDVTQTWGLQYNPGSGEVTIVPIYTGSFICLDFSSYSPEPDDSWRPYGGDQYAGCAAANGAVNNDWLISPQLSFQDSPRISFFAKSLAADYYPESFNVLYSTTGNSYTNFAGNYLNSTQPQTVGLDWTLFEYELPAACANTNVYIAIQCVSNDMFMLMIDDFVAGHLAGPALTISDDEWDYGLAFIGASNCTPRVFTATNAGSGTVTINNPPTLEGTDAGQFTLTDANTYPIALDTSESASWTVKFTPTSWGEKDDAYLRIVDDLAKSGLTIYVQDPVSGEGQAVKGPGMVPNADKGNRDDAPKQKATNAISLRGFGVEGLMEDYFEYYSHRDQSFGYWTLHDKDLEITNGIYIGATEYFAPYTGSFIVFDDQAVPELSNEDWMAYSGDKWVGSFDVAATGVLNDDWMVTPALDFDNDPRISFFAKSPNSSYAPERFKVYYSTTGDAYSNFTGNYVAGSATTWIEPSTEWTKYEYSIPALANHTGWIAIQCVSDDSWVLQIDDFVAGHRALYDVDPPIITELLNVAATSTVTLTVTNISASAWSYTGFSDTANWLTYTDASGTIAAGDHIQIVLNFNATGLTANSTYTTDFVITTDFGTITVPVTLTVLAANNAIPVNPRMAAQWEDAVGVGIAWDYYNVGNPQGNKFGIPDGLIVELSQTTTVFIACDTDQQTACTNYLSGIGAILANCKFVNFPTNTYWARDWGPWHIFHGDSRGREMSLVDFDYNRPRPLDDAAAGYINTYIEANYPTNYDNTLFKAPIIHTGGNIMTDGNGAAMSTNLVRDDNDGDPVYDYTPVTAFNYTDAQIAAIMKEFLGIDNYMIFQDPDNDLNTTVDHMDCWSKLLDVDIVMIQRVPDTADEYQLTENAATDWATRASSYGEHFPYRIHRVDEIPGTNGTNYTNCFIHNRKIYIPAYGGTLADMDAAAIAAYQAAMPQYAVQGYIAKTSDPWLASDAVHCRINTIWDSQMVHIWHHPLWGSVPPAVDVVLPIEITSYNALNADSTYVTYQLYDAATDTWGAWVDVPLSMTTTSNPTGYWVNMGSNDYTMTIPGVNLAVGDSIHYAIIANDVNNNEHWLRLNRRQDPFLLDVRATHTLIVLSQDQNGNPITGYTIYRNGLDTGQDTGYTFTNQAPGLLAGTYSLSSPPEGFVWEAITIPVSSSDFTAGNNYTVTIIFKLKSEDPLPIELSSFTATISAQNFISLTWVTQSETGVLGFYILRNVQDDLANAVTISQLITATNTSQQQTYVFTDDELYEDGTYYYWLQNSDLDGTVAFHGPISIAYTTTGGNIPGIPLVTELKPVYPNPFNPRATIPFSLKESTTVSFEIYNTRGQLVRRIPIGDKAAGYHQTEWDGRDGQGRACGTGVYHIRMTAGTESFFRKAVLMK